MVAMVAITQVSSGAFVAQAVVVDVIVPGDTWTFFRGVSEPTPAGWTDVVYDDSAVNGWESGPSGFGYGDGDDATVLSDMLNGYASVYIRNSFNIADASLITGLELTVIYDDGYVAYLNGVEVARANVTGTPPAFDDLADSITEPTTDVRNISTASLVTGTNVLAIQGHNQGLSSSDFSLIPSLTSSDTPPLPADPTGLTIVDTRDTEIDLSWTDNSFNETGFEVEISSSGSGGPFTSYAVVAIDQTALTVTGLNTGTQYCFRVKALGATGDSDYTAVECGVTTESTIGGLPISEGQLWRYFKGTTEPPATWNTVGFDASTWLSGPSGLGYGDGDDATVLNDMQSSYPSLYIRREFSIPDLATVVSLALDVDYDDSFVAYLNGVEVARAGVSGTPPAFNTLADSEHEAGAPVAFDITAHLGLLNEAPGTNVLALQGHNRTLGSSDFSLIPELDSGGASSGLIRGPYLQNPSEGSMTVVFATNSAGAPTVDYAPVLGWTALGFDDSLWLTGPTGIGYGDGDDATVLTDMQNSYISVLARKEFTVADAAAVAGMTLTMDFDDGFVAYLNGVEIARDNVPGVGLAATGAGDQREASGGNTGPQDPLVFDLGGFLGLLQTGTNVLAVSGHNEMASSSDFSLIPVLEISDPAPSDVIPAGAVWSYFKGTSEPGVGTTVQTAGTSTFYSELGGHFQHEVVLTGLTPDASYTYQLFLDGTPFSDPLEFAFRASPANGSETPFEFILFGDSGGLSTAQFDLRDRFATETYDLTLIAGDVVNGNGTWTELQAQFFDVYENLWSYAPVVPASGNHEYLTESGMPHREAFVLPENSLPGDEERYYSFDYGNVHFIALDTEIIDSDQAAWLEADLAATDQPVKIAYFHRNVFGEGSRHPIDEMSLPTAGAPLIRQWFSPLFEQYGVIMSFNGHNHMYGRSVPIKNATPDAPYGQATTVLDGGVTYTNSGGGGWSQDVPYTDPFFTAPDGFSFSDAHYTKVSISGCAVELQAIDTNNVVRDTVSIADACTGGGGPSGVTLTTQVMDSADDAYDNGPAPGFPGFSATDTIVYAGAPGASGPVYGGWRWTGMAIPTNAVISEAYVEISQSAFGNEIQTTLSFEDSASPQPFDSLSTPADRWANRTTFERTWTADLQVPNTWIRSPNIADGVRELLLTHGVLGEIVLLESGEGVTQGEFHQWRSYDGDPTRGARLVIRFAEDTSPPTDPTSLSAVGAEHNRVDLSWSASIDDVGIDFYRIFRDGAPVGTSPSTTFSDNGVVGEMTYSYQVSAVDLAGKESGLSNMAEATTPPAPIIVQVSSSTDDAHVDPDSWPGYNDTATFVYAGRPGANDPVTGGFRFTGLGLPENSTITAAWVELTQAGYGNLIQTTLSLESSASPETFSGANSPGDRTSTAFSVPWTWPGSSPGALIQTPSLTAGIQELVDAYGALDSIVLLESGLLSEPISQYHTWTSFDGNPAQAARIHIEYLNGPDTSPPVISDGAPTGLLAPGTTSVLLTVTTDEDATCNRDDLPGIDFGSMADVFTTTGGTAHSMTISGLSDGDIKTNHIRCQDGLGFANQVDYVVSFEIAVPDAIPPVVSNPLPTGALLAGTTQTLISVETDEATTCKYGTVSGEPFGSGLLTLFSTTGGLAHSSTVTGLVDDTSYTFYALCQDLSGNVSSPETVISFSVLAPPLVTSGVVAGSADDAHEDPDSWPGYSQTSGSVYAGRPGGNGPATGGFRFTGLSVPENAIITSAYVELTQSGYGNAIATNLSFESSASPAAFSPGSTPVDRSGTAYSIDWTWNGSGPGSVVQTPSLVAGIQELVDDFGALDTIVLLESGLLTEPLGQYHTWVSFDTNPAQSAKIFIEYAEGADTSPPVLSAAAPTGVLPPGTTSVLLSVLTNEDATCRRDDLPGVTYEQMADLFATTGSTSHSTTITGLSDGDASTHHIRCQDALGNTNTDDLVVTFSIAVPDGTPPVVSNPLPTGNLLAGTTQTLISVETDEAATCKYGTVSGEAFESVLLTLFSATGGLAHSSTVTGLVDDTSYTFYALCRDLSGNDSIEAVISFDVLSAPLATLGQVAGSTDDAYVDSDSWPGYSQTSGSIYAGRPGANNPVTSGFRFTGLTIPANAVITSAYVELAQSGYGNTIATNLSFESAASPSTFSPGDTPEDRTSTAYSTDWTWTPVGPGSVIETPSLVDGIQELVDTYGALSSVVLLEAGLLTEPLGQYHTWTSFDSNPALAARIFVEYVLP